MVAFDDVIMDILIVHWQIKFSENVGHFKRSDHFGEKSLEIAIQSFWYMANETWYSAVPL